MTLVYPLRIELRDFKPAIYRDVLVDLAAFFLFNFKKNTGQKVVTGNNFLPPSSAASFKLSETPEYKTTTPRKK